MASDNTTATSSPQQFCVKWNSYHSNLQNAFPKLLLSENFVDVTLACEKQMIKCHKVVLSACSSYFETLLSENPCQHPIIFMKDMRYWEIKSLVDFMYRGEVNVTQEQLSKLLRAAESLQIRGLYGSEQQRVAAAAVAACSKDEGPPACDEAGSSTQVLPVAAPQECKAEPDDSNDQMVKLEEEIMMIEEQSISNSSQDYLASSQEFDGFIGDQHYPPPPLLPEEGTSSNIVQTVQIDNHQFQASPQFDPGTYKIKLKAPNKLKKATRVVTYEKIRPAIMSEDHKEILRQKIIEAVRMEQEGHSFRSISRTLEIPKSTIHSYVAKYKKGLDIFQRI